MKAKPVRQPTLGLFGILSALLATGPALGQTTALITTFTNPAPAASDNFGVVAAAVGSDRVLIAASRDDAGATNAGAVYLFSTNGTLLTTFTNPTPALDDTFGVSVAVVGSARVLIGAYLDDTGAADAGAAYLFSTNGGLLATIPNPTPADSEYFGYAVAALDSERVLIGAEGDDTSGVDVGVAYLFSLNGTLLTTFTNPAPAGFDGFGVSVAAVGDDRVLIGTIARDAAYLFSTNGTLVTTFTNPTPAFSDYFAYSVAAVGNDRVLISAEGDSTVALGAGAAYLFSTNGALLTTFTNPTAANSDAFGGWVAAVGSDRVVIGAYGDDTGATDAGAAYLFSTTGALLATFTNPTPAVGDYFGYPVIGVGGDCVLIGADGDSTAAPGAGAAYLFTAAPSLRIGLTTTNTVAVSWPSPFTGFSPQQNTSGVATVNWSNVTDTIADDGTTRTLIANPPTGKRFYRLVAP